jgi:tRNA pseudouridine55 synthase
MNPQPSPQCEGILLLDKPKGKTAFDLVALLRRKLHVRTIGHAGTLDPMATGVMVMLIGKKYTTLSNQFLSADKEYVGRIHLGIETDTFDAEGTSVATSDKIPTEAEVLKALESFQGQISQIPPMYSAKKINGQKLYHLARQGKTIERPPQFVSVKSEFLSYAYPHIDVRITCSKGTYIRSIAHDLGQMLQCGAHLSALVRTRSGSYNLSECIKGDHIYNDEISHIELTERLRKNKD